MEELWKDIENYEGKYQVSNTGKVRSLNYNNTGKPRELKQKINKNGYCEITLSKNNKSKTFMVGNLVAKHFLEDYDPDLEVMHIGDSKDNNINNLKCACRSEILHNAYKKGTRTTGKPSEKNMFFEGKGYKNISDMAKAHGLKPKQVFKRLSRGWSLDEALNTPIAREDFIIHTNKYEYYDKDISVKELSKITGINKKAIYKRLARNWSFYECDIPLAIKNMDKKENENEL